jgi:F-type H+-transporting ATPase subunit b
MEHHGFFSEAPNWVLISFFLFFILVGRKIWAALAAMLDARTEKVRAELDEASRLRTEAEALLRDAEKRRTEALAEAKALIAGAQTQASQAAAATMAEAEASARRREQMAIDRIAAAEKAAVDEVRMAAVDVATIAARDIIASGLTAEADAGLIDHAIGNLPSALAARRAA